MRYFAGLCFVAALVLLPAPRSSGAEEDPAARKAKVAAAKEKLKAAENALGARVNQAIDKGLGWLRKQQRKDGGFPGLSEDRTDARAYNVMDVGLNALVLHTFAHCGATIDDKAVKKCLLFCTHHYSGDPKSGSWNLFPTGRLTVYTAATLIMALDALYSRASKKSFKVKRDRYGNIKAPKRVNCKYPKKIDRWIRQMVAFLIENQHASGGWRYPGNPVGSEEAETDISNTQYALLALEAAASCGIPVPVAVWKKALNYLVKEQEEEGLDGVVWMQNEVWEPGLDDVPQFVEAGKAQVRGWAYAPGHVALPTGAMTAAGITGLCVIKERLWAAEALDPATRRRIDRAVIDGLVWLGEFFTVEKNPEASDAPAQWHYYYLYGLERAGVKSGLTFFGKKRWYRPGAEYLLSAQTKKGGWPAGGGPGKVADHTESPITQTCFALLFLRRSTRKPLIPMTPTVTGGDER